MPGEVGVQVSMVVCLNSEHLLRDNQTGAGGWVCAWSLTMMGLSPKSAFLRRKVSAGLPAA